MTQEDPSGAEKRRFKRLNRKLVVSVQPPESISTEWDVVVVQNISRGGLLFSTTSEYEKGMVLKFKINIVLNKNPIPCSGKVVRVKMLPGTHFYEIGVALTQIHPTDADLIDATVEEFLTKKQEHGQ